MYSSIYLEFFDFPRGFIVQFSYLACLLLDAFSNAGLLLGPEYAFFFFHLKTLLLLKPEFYIIKAFSSKMVSTLVNGFIN